MARKRIAGWHRDMGKALKGLVLLRNQYDAIHCWKPSRDNPPGLYQRTPEAHAAVTEWRAKVVNAATVLDFFREALPEEYCSFDHKRRGGSLNHDLYAYCPQERVAIVQARHAYRHKADYFMEVHKTYFLVGHNEITKAPFRHPISSAVVRAAVRKHRDDQGAIIRACQAWMFDVTEKQLALSVRQGDVLLISSREPKEPLEVLGTTAKVDSHVVEAAEVVRDGHLFARDLTIRHEKGQHREVMASGWHRVTLARSAAAWDFATRMGD